MSVFFFQVYMDKIESLSGLDLIAHKANRKLFFVFVY